MNKHLEGNEIMLFSVASLIIIFVIILVNRFIEDFSLIGYLLLVSAFAISFGCSTYYITKDYERKRLEKNENGDDKQ